MKLLSSIIALIFISVIFYSCNAQPRSNYEISTEQISGITKYHFFLEKKSTSPYHLLEDMDYLNPDVTTYEIYSGANNYAIVNLENDGGEYTIGLVVENAAGYYSAMKTAIVNVGTSPQKPAVITFRRLN